MSEETTSAVPALSEVEHIKTASRHLRGTLAEGLVDTANSGFSGEDHQLLKFHGMYQQKNRDDLKNAVHSFMIRGRISGGRVSAAQYLVWDSLADRFGGGALRLTTRQSIQMHGLLKGDLQTIIREIWDSGLSSMGACGDVVRNVTQPVNPWQDPRLSHLDAPAQLLSDHFKFQSHGYAEIWLGEERVDPAAEKESFYGETYLPRKFKIAVTAAGHNEIDIYTNDLAFAATYSASGSIDGYFVFAGGGMGMTHNNPKTFPRAADLLGWVEAAWLIPAAEAVVSIARDAGDRTNRKHARLKYVIAEKGLDWMKAETAARLGRALEDKPLPAWCTRSNLGWHQAADGSLALGVHLLCGRIIDKPGRAVKTALREVIQATGCGVQLTPDQDLVLVGIAPAHRATVEASFARHGFDPASPSPLRDRAMACVSFPTCSMAITESERVFDGVLQQIEAGLGKYQLSDRAPIVRMTGCPNGCARPYAAEIGIVGQTRGTYAIFLGGQPEGTCVGTQVLAKVALADIGTRLDALFALWAAQGRAGERLGTFVARHGLQTVAAALQA